MNDVLIRNYLKNLNFINEKQMELESITDEDLSVINDLSDFILKNKEYSCLNTFVGLADALVEFIESYNKSGSLKESQYDLNSLKKAFSNFKNELENEYDINIYFYGKDNFGIIDNNLLKLPIRRIYNKPQFNKIASKKKSNNKTYNVIILGEEVLFKNTFFDEAFYYNKIVESLYTIVKELYKCNYNLKYLENSLKECGKENIDTIIVGNSYSLVGIEESSLDCNSVNLSMHSQDLYYTFKMARTAIANNKNIKRCIFGISYYVLRHDLSKGRSSYSEDMIKNVYYPLFQDIHNSKLCNIQNPKKLSDLNADFLVKSIFDINKVEEYLSFQIYSKNKMYYNNTVIPIYKHTNWMNFSEIDKEIIGKNRADLHNKLFKYEETKKEYTKLFYEFFNFLKEYNVEPIVVVFPTTEYYSKNISAEFKEEFEMVINSLEEKAIQVIDLRKYDSEFSNVDFADSDHLNDVGAIKATNYIKFELENKEREREC